MVKRSTGATARRKNLHDGQSLWHDSPGTRVRTRSQPGADHYDIVVVGAGITGSITALVLAAADHEVAVLDRRTPGSGSTLASTAMIQFEIDTPLIELGDTLGPDKAKRAYLRSARAVRDLGRLLAEHGIDASWQDRDALYLAGDKLGFRALKAEAEARRAIGLPSRFLSKGDVRERFGIDTTGAILSSSSAELDPARAAAGCLKAAQALGATVVSPCEVVRFDGDAHGVTLELAGGGAITCRKAIFATGYEVIEGVPGAAYEIVSSWAIATAPIAAERFWRGRCLIWEAADPYLYLRASADDRVLIGGEDSGLRDPDRRAAAIPAKAEKLIRKARRLLEMPDLEIDYAWAGAFADSPTGLPAILPLAGQPNAMAILGCGGNGITFSVIASDLAKAWVRGRKDRDAGLFDGKPSA